ncbi:MAG: SPOR domain-containing protein [Chitinophagaceae bacterium]|nr:SPOR domain-containing protein [Chitinophagaceae bacterium]
MKKIIVLIAFVTFCFTGFAQDKDSAIVQQGKVTVIKDARIDILGRKLQELNKTVSYGPRAAQGYRLMVVSSNDRDFAMKVRAQLLQRFPEQKVYMAYQAPYIKIKFGNFVEKGDAEKYKKMIKQAGIVSTNVYVVPEIVEVKPDKDKENEEEK